MEEKKGKYRIKKIHYLRIIWIVIIVTLVLIFGRRTTSEIQNNKKLNMLEEVMMPDWVDVQFIDIGQTARTGVKLETVRDIVIHYVGNPDTSAQQNRDYFNTPGSEVDSHFIIGLEGEVIQCLPLNEKSAASNWRNKDTISIEVCHPDKTGEFTEATYQALIKLISFLCDTCKLSEKHIIRHYDITGKECPIYYVQHEGKWMQLKTDVFHFRKANSQLE